MVRGTGYPSRLIADPQRGASLNEAVSSTTYISFESEARSVRNL